MSRRAKLLLNDDQVAKSKPRRKRDPAQPNLPFDRMPDRIEPCLATLKPEPPKDDGWIYEMKWDGCAQAPEPEIDHENDTGGRRTRPGNDNTGFYDG